MTTTQKKIVASIQVVALNTDKEEFHEIISKAINFIKNQTNIEFRPGHMNSTIGGYYDDVMSAINNVQKQLLSEGDNEFLVNICIHSSASNDIDIIDKDNRYIGI